MKTAKEYNDYLIDIIEQKEENAKNDILSGKNKEHDKLCLAGQLSAYQDVLSLLRSEKFLK